MARFTIDDCVEEIENRFLLTIVAAKRAREIFYNGSCLLENLENDKPTVLALREIADGLITADSVLKNSSND